MIIEDDKITIHKIKNMYQEIYNEFNNNDKITINLKNVDEIDMSGLQLLVSLKKSCEKEDKKLYIENIKEDLLYSFELSGLDSILEV